MRRSDLLFVIAGLALAAPGCTGANPGPKSLAATVAPTTETLTLTGDKGRSISVLAVTPQNPRGVILFSHGGGSAPQANQPLLETLAREGFAVLAPTYTDSMRLPEAQRTSLQAAFATRVADQKAVAGYAAARYAGLPVGAVGYSYGALTALIGGGAFAPYVPGRLDGLKAVVMYSSPGRIPGLSDAPNALVQATTPSLMITGTADTVPGFVSDPALHLTYLTDLPAGDHTALMVKDATHLFAAGKEQGNAEVTAAMLQFLKSRMLGDSPAAKAYAKLGTTNLIELRRR